MLVAAAVLCGGQILALGTAVLAVGAQEEMERLERQVLQTRGVVVVVVDTTLQIPFMVAVQAAPALLS